MAAPLPPGVDLSQIPLTPNPNGSPPNFEGGPTLQPTILATGIVFIAISFPCVAIRLRTGLGNAHRLHLDDLLCLLGLILGTTYWVVFYQLQVKSGIAKHSWDVALSAITPTVNKAQVVAQILSTLGNAAIKSAILLFFVRLFGALRWVRILGFGLTTLVLSLYGSYLISLLVLCIPTSGHAWDSALLERCNTTTPGTIAVGAIAVFIDATMFAMPFFIITGLNMTRDRKWSLAIVFSIGFLIVVTSIVGLAYKIILAAGTQDPLWNGTNVSITAYIEIFGSVIVSCTPSLSSFWFGTFIRTRVYTSLRSAFSRAKLHNSSEMIPVQPLHSTSQLSDRVGSEASQDQDPKNTTPVETIKKSTLISQHTNANTDEEIVKQGGALGVRHPYREQW